jgi:nucleoside-diphosphate-sugar epimerase
MYRASKTLAARAFWKFIEEKKTVWDGATICPPMVYGPILQQISSTSELNTSNATILDWLTGNKKQSDIPEIAGFNWVDVRDVALAHVRALTVEEAGGERFIVGAGPGSPNDLVVSFERHFPDRTTYPKGDASKVEAINAKSNRYDGSKAERILGIKYHDIDTSVKDTVESLVKRLGV